MADVDWSGRVFRLTCRCEAGCGPRTDFARMLKRLFRQHRLRVVAIEERTEAGWVGIGREETGEHHDDDCDRSDQAGTAGRFP